MVSKLDTLELDKAISLLKTISKTPEDFIDGSSSLSSSVSKLTKLIYDFTKSREKDPRPDQTLPDLPIDEFQDAEQVWAAIDLQNSLRLPEIQDDIQRYQMKLRIKSGIKKQRQTSESSEDDFKIPDSKRVRFEDDRVKQEEKDDGEEGEDPDNMFDDDEEEEENFHIPTDDENDDDEKEEEEETDNVLEKKEDEDDFPENKDILADPDFAHMSDSDGDDLPLFENARSDDDDDEEKEWSDGNDANKDNIRNKIDEEADEYMANAMKNIRSRISVVDDKFFKLSDMERFLEFEDKKAENKNNEEDGNELDLFETIEGDETEENAMYADYFENSNQVEKSSFDSKPKDILEDSSDSEMEIEDDKTVKSAHEKRTERLEEKIRKLEKEAVSEKPWRMAGEVVSEDRPLNSLLDTDCDFDSTLKRAPIITEKVSQSLEAIIVQRIKDKAWDDVERKIKPVKDPYEYKKKLVLDQEKSKLSLAQVYEEEYLRQKGELNKEETSVDILAKDENETPINVENIKKEMRVLFSKLDILSHHHYTPALPDPEIKVIKNIPAIRMEEVAPVGISDATLLAPQEVAKKARGMEIGETERSETDKKRNRRKKKHSQKLKAAAKESNSELVNNNSKEQALKSLEKSSKKGNGGGGISIIKDSSGPKIKSSASFFDQLQNQISTKKGSKEVNKKNKKKTGSKLKL